MDLNFPIKKIRYSGENLSSINIALGGIGTGCVYLNSNGSINNFKISNFPDNFLKKLVVSFSVAAEDNGNIYNKSLIACQESFSEKNCGFFSCCDFIESFPFGEICFKDEFFPGKITLVAFNPLIPHNNIDSTIPAAFLEFEITNDTTNNVTYTLSGNINNPYNSKVNEFYSTRMNNICGIRIASDVIDSKKIGKTEFSLGICGEDIRHCECVNGEDLSSISSCVTLKPSEKKKIRFIISWYSTYGNTELKDYFTDSETIDTNISNLWKNYYTKYFTGADEVVYYCLSQWERLYEETDLFRKLLFSSTVTAEDIKKISNSIQYIKTENFIRYEDGCFYPLYDVGDYSHPFSFLFPSLERLRLFKIYENHIDKFGAINFETISDSGVNTDASELNIIRQLATILAVYRQFNLSGDIGWLTDIWPCVVKSIKYLWHTKNPYKFDSDKVKYAQECDDIQNNHNFINRMYFMVLYAAVNLATVVRDKKNTKEFLRVYQNAIDYNHVFSEQDLSASIWRYNYSQSYYSIISEICGLEFDTFNKSYKICPNMKYLENGVFRCFLSFENFLGFIESGIDYMQIYCVKGSILVRNISLSEEPLLVKAGGYNIGFSTDGNTAILDNDCEINSKRDLFIVLRT